MSYKLVYLGINLSNSCLMFGHQNVTKTHFEGLFSAVIKNFKSRVFVDITTLSRLLKYANKIIISKIQNFF